MQEIIVALQEEIAAAQKKYSEHTAPPCHGYGEERRLTGYIQGLNTALYLLTKEPVKELGY